ncbi:MAG: (E)-4-hydroxy-3-methylbut-2-enyl-diphosphate synthase [Chitinophagaceae bacterium]
MSTDHMVIPSYRRLPTREVKAGDLSIGNFHPIRIQTMTTTDTLDTRSTVEQSIRCIEAGAELIRITAPSKNEAENLLTIRNELRKRGYKTPLVADIHFTPNAAEIAARIVEKVRINPGNYVDKKKFEQLDYTEGQYQEEIDRIRERFSPLVRICKEYGTAMRIGTNHGSLSDRIMSRYGDTPMGMVESAMEFLRIAEDLHFFNIVLSMKASNPHVMIEACRLLIRQMAQEKMNYPLHLGVTEAGDGEDGRIKSAIGIGTLLEEGIGDTIRVSLTEDPEFELPVCRELVRRQQLLQKGETTISHHDSFQNEGGLNPNRLPELTPQSRNPAHPVLNIGGRQVPVVMASLSHLPQIRPEDLADLGYLYDPKKDKWHISDAAADYIFTGKSLVHFDLPGTLRVLVDPPTFALAGDDQKYFPLFSAREYLDEGLRKSTFLNMVLIERPAKKEDPFDPVALFRKLKSDTSTVVGLSFSDPHGLEWVRNFLLEMSGIPLQNPVILVGKTDLDSPEAFLIHYSTLAGALFLDHLLDGLFLGLPSPGLPLTLSAKSLNSLAFGILQATRTRISRTEYISCPSCGRTLFDLQETTARIRAVTHHLKGVKIAIMGCIVNGPGEMADADFGYVGSGVGKVTLYRGRDIVKRSLPSSVAVEELIQLIKDSGNWVEN